MGAEAEIKGGWPEGARGAAASGTARTNRHTTRLLLLPGTALHWERGRPRVAMATSPKGHHLLFPYSLPSLFAHLSRRARDYEPERRYHGAS